MPSSTPIFSQNTVKRGKHLLVSLPLVLLLAACGTPILGGGADGTQQNTLQQLVSQQDRLYRVAAPLMVHNAELCKDNARNLLGFTAKNRYSYSAELTGAAA